MNTLTAQRHQNVITMSKRTYCNIWVVVSALLLLSSQSAHADNSAKFPILSQNNQSDKVALLEINDSKEKVALSPGYGAKDFAGISVLWLVKSKEVASNRSIRTASSKTDSIIKMEQDPANLSSENSNNFGISDNAGGGSEKNGSEITHQPENPNAENSEQNNSSDDALQNYSDEADSESNSNSGTDNNSNDSGAAEGGVSGPPITNQPPVILVGASEINAHFGENVTLNGANSYDPEGFPLTYLWEQTGGESVSIVNSNSPISQLVAPSIQTTLSFRLTVRDISGVGSSASITVHIYSPGVQYNPDPVINQGDALSLAVISGQILTFSLTADDENGKPDGLTWIIGSSSAQGSVSFDDNLTERTSSPRDSVAVHYKSDPGFYGSDTFTVQVNDYQGGMDEISVSVSVQMALHVDDNGSSQPNYDAGEPLGSERHPYPTFEEGLNYIQSGGILYVQEGIYDWGVNDTIDKSITIEGIGANKPTLAIPLVFVTALGSGSHFKNLELKSGGGFFLAISPGQNVSNITLDGIHLIGTADWSGLMTTIDSNPEGVNDGWIIRNSTFECARSEYECLLFNYHSNLLIENNVFLNSNPTVTDIISVYVGKTRGDVVFRGNIFAESGGNAIHIENSNYGQPNEDSGRLYIVNNTFYGMRASPNAYYTGAIYQSQMDEIIINNLFVNNAAVAIHGWNLLNGYNPSASWVDYNLYYSNNGSSDNSLDDVTVMTHPRFTIDSFTHDTGPDVDPQLLSQTYGNSDFLRFRNDSPAATGAYQGSVPGYSHAILTKNGTAYFGALEPID